MRDLKRGIGLSRLTSGRSARPGMKPHFLTFKKLSNFKDDGNAMSRALLSGGSYRLGSKRILLATVYTPLQSSRAASLNSAIGRGLRKSKGVGFRGKERSQARYNDFDGKSTSRDGAASIIRRTGDPPVISLMIREGARVPFRHERRAAARAEQDFGGHAMRLRIGKRELKDPRALGTRRSRAARFNDPSHSFGKRSIPVEWREDAKYAQDEDCDHDIEEVRKARRSNLSDVKIPSGGRKRPTMSTAKQRAAESDIMSLDRNPNRLKLSKSRFAYLAKTDIGHQKAEEKTSWPSREQRTIVRDRREPYRSVQNHPGPRINNRDPNEVPQREREWKFHSKESYQAVREDPEARVGSRDGFPTSDRKKPFGLKLDGSTSAVRPSFTQTQDNRYPLSITYTTPASEFLYGTSVVEAALLSRRNPRRKLYKLYVYTGENRENAERDDAMEKLAKKNKIDIVRVDTNNLRLMDKMSQGRPHNGYVLESSPLPRLPVTALGELTGIGDREGFSVLLDYQSREDAAVNGTETFISTLGNVSGRKPFVLFLDSIMDPGNLGGIIRTASFLGVTAIAISTKNSASFTPVVLKASAGASENVTLFSVSKPAGFITDSKFNGWKIYAAVAPSGRGGPKSITTDELENPLTDGPCILMLGNEGEGLRWNLRSKADVELVIQGSTGSSGVDSLNVSVATGILCTSFLRRHPNVSRRPKQVEEILVPKGKLF